MRVLAFAPPASMVPFTALTVIVSVWFVFTALVAAAGVMWMFASTHVLLAGLLLTRPLRSEERRVGTLVRGMFDVADSNDGTVVAAVSITMKLALAPPPV